VRTVLSILLPTLLFVNSTLPAQTPQRPDTTRADSIRRISPGKAFYRSVLVPGWGQFSVDADRRGAVFVALQTTSWFMLVKTLHRLGQAKDLEGERIGLARDSIEALMRTDTTLNRRFSNPDTLQAAIDSTRSVSRARRLVVSRRQQRQDWITYTLVLTLASGVDAFVAAHLADFPAVVGAEPRVGGGMNLRVGIPLPQRRRQ
jgi:hypothetical protein